MWEALGQTTVAAAGVPTINTATRVAMVGDSLTYGSLPFQPDAFLDVGWADSSIDAFGSRGILTKIGADPHDGLKAVDAIRSVGGDSDLWVVALGTNDSGIYSSPHYESVISQMLHRIGSQHHVMWVNIFLPKLPQRQAAWNMALDQVSVERAGQMYVYDWASLVAQNPKWMAGDGVHNSTLGYQERANAIAQASRNLDAFLAMRARMRFF
ncbi:MAG TPA: GDSL-type esterase/lipase family protein [Ilumatobacteraceae bacterium]